MEMPLYQRRRLRGDLSIASADAVLDRDGVIEGDTAAVFANWRRADCSLALWRRDVSAGLIAAFDALDLDCVAGFRTAASADEAPPRIVEAVATCGFGSRELTSFLAADIALLIRHFATVTGTRQLDARLEVVRDDACRRYHVDNMPARLVVTYVGPGTVFVPLSRAEEARARQVAYEGPTIAMPRFAAGLFAGATATRPGLVHRSPRIKASGEKRLFFCVNQSAN